MRMPQEDTNFGIGPLKACSDHFEYVFEVRTLGARRANAVILRCERAFISAFTRVFNALWRASLEGGRVSLSHHGAVGTVSAVHPPIKSGAGSSRLACSQVAACSRLRMTAKCLYCVGIRSDRKALYVSFDRG